MDAAIQNLIGIRSLGRVPVHGRTDAAIIRQLFAQNGLDYSDPLRGEFQREYLQLLPRYLESSPGTVLPGVIEVLRRLSSDSNVMLGIITGNMRAAAVAKLRHFGLLPFFAESASSEIAIGGFGDEHPDRNDVAAAAHESARQVIADDQAAAAARTVVVGDTVHDIECARHIGAVPVAVLTGGVEAEELEKSAPHSIFENMADNSFLDVLVSPG